MLTTNAIEQDQNQRYIALDMTQSFIVQAPAGSGKTELLIQRFLTLLSHVKKPEEILAITFTKKAANEMRNRIIQALHQAQQGLKPENPHAQHSWHLAKKALQQDQQFSWEILQNPNQLHIQTIDSFCADLANQLPLLSRFGASPKITDHPNKLYRQAVEEVLTHIEENFEWSAAIEKILWHVDNDLNKLHELLIQLLAKRDQWLPFIHWENSENLQKQMELHFFAVLHEKLQYLKTLFPHEILTEWLCLARFAADQLFLNNNNSPILHCRDLVDIPKDTFAAHQTWLGLATLVLTKNHQWRKRLDNDIGFPPINALKNPKDKELHLAMRQRLKSLIDVLVNHESWRFVLTDLFFLPHPSYQNNQWEILQALLQVLKITVAQLHLTFKQYGQIDFIENAQAALLALGDDEHPTDLSLALDYRIQHILIDEFQDTSLTQYRLLEKLTLGWQANDGHTLFVVGDPMQSIYRFREAEVGLFLRMCKYGLGQIKLKPLQLSVNFRSTPTLVAWNNQFFKKIFPTCHDITLGAVAYSPSQAFVDNDSNSIIQVQGFLQKTSNEIINHSQAYYISDSIKTLKQQFPQETVAILVRSRADLVELMPILKKAQITYQAIDIEPLSKRQVILDLTSLTCALLHPADRISWLSVLRAPWCGLSLENLLIIAEDPFITIWEQLNHSKIQQHLNSAGKKNLQRILPILQHQIAERERHSLRCWIESTWLLLGGPACLLPDEVDDVNTYFRLLDNIGNEENIINIDFLHNRIEQLYATNLYHAEDAMVQIMTIHNAKGLEFDTVIIPHLESKTAKNERALLEWMDYPLQNERIALLLAPIHPIGTDYNAMYEYIYRQKKLRHSLETDRLLYVATTRAKKRLYLLFDGVQNKENEISVEVGSFLARIWPHVEKQSDNVLSKETLTHDQSSLSTRHLIRITSSWENPFKLNDHPAVAYHQTQRGFALQDNAAILIGIVTHKILQMISQLGIPWWRDINHHQYINQQLKILGIAINMLVTAENKIQLMIKNTLNDQRGQWILQNHSDAKSEYAISAQINQEVQRLVIDRTFVDEGGTRWIIDYKTSTLSQHDLNDFLKNQQEKHLEKMKKYCHAMQQIDKRPIRLGLYFPAFPAWYEWN